MRVVTVARKPCASGGATANILEHGAGALNIDACRIAYRSDSDKTLAVGRGEFEREDGVGASFPHHKDGWGQWHVNHGGRWPPNVLLVHRSGCKVVGEKKVKTGTAVRHRSGGKTIFSETEKAPLPDMSYADADGNETMPQWVCEDGCPVAELDRQSGNRKSGSGTVKRASSRDGHGNMAAAFGSESRPSGSPQVWYGDMGGASRFFKQAKPGSPASETESQGPASAGAKSTVDSGER